MCTPGFLLQSSCRESRLRPKLVSLFGSGVAVKIRHQVSGGLRPEERCECSGVVSHQPLEQTRRPSAPPACLKDINHSRTPRPDGCNTVLRMAEAFPANPNPAASGLRPRAKTKADIQSYQGEFPRSGTGFPRSGTGFPNIPKRSTSKFPPRPASFWTIVL